jgi:cytochrome P450
MPDSSAQQAVAPVTGADGHPPLPVGVELTPLSEAYRTNPYPTLARLRTERPVHWDSVLSRWFLTSYDDVRTILRNKEMSNNPHTARPDSFSAKVVSAAHHGGMGNVLGSLLFLDDPEHRRVRALVSKPFSISAVESRRAQVRAVAERLLDGVTAERFDLVSALAGPLPVIVIAEMLGVDPAQRDRFKRCTEDVIATFFNPLRTESQVQAGARAAQELATYFIEAIELRRQNPRDDLLSAMVLAREDSQPLTTEEILAQSSLLLVAGNVTTTALIGNAVRCLLQHPDEVAVLRADPSLIPNAIEEVLRYDTSVMQATRVVPKNMSFGGCPFQQGQTLQVQVAAANHDPRANPDPERFDIRRKDIKHLSFGGNQHLCLGAPLARVEAQEAVAAVLRRFPDLQLSQQEFQFYPWPGFRGTRELWLSRG